MIPAGLLTSKIRQEDGGPDTSAPLWQNSFVSFFSSPDGDKRNNPPRRSRLFVFLINYLFSYLESQPFPPISLHFSSDNPSCCSPSSSSSLQPSIFCFSTDLLPPSFSLHSICLWPHIFVRCFCFPHSSVHAKKKKNWSQKSFGSSGFVKDLTKSLEFTDCWGCSW